MQHRGFHGGTARSGPLTELPLQKLANRTVALFALLFLVCYGLGLVLSRYDSSAVASACAAYYTDPKSFAQYTHVFGVQFLAGFSQLSLIAIFGFCALGPVLLAGYFALKGIWLGFCTTAILTASGTKGLVAYWLLTWLPETGELILALILCAQAAILSAGLWKYTFFAAQMHTAPRQAAARFGRYYLLLNLGVIALSALGAGLALLLAAVLL